MEYKTLEINDISAKDLKNLNLFSKMDVYVVVSLSGYKQRAKTEVDRKGGTSPSWNFPVKFTIDESAARQNRLNLEFKLRCERSLGRDKDIGVVYVPVAKLPVYSDDGKSMQVVSYQVTRPSGKPHGILNFSCKFMEKVATGGELLVPEAKAHEPVTAYPAPVVGTSALPYNGSYPPAAASHPPPPPPPPYGYGYPPPLPGYGYPGPPPPCYGYQPAVQQPQKMNKFWTELGAVLLGRALGGLLIGDMPVPDITG